MAAACQQKNAKKAKKKKKKKKKKNKSKSFGQKKKKQRYLVRFWELLRPHGGQTGHARIVKRKKSHNGFV
jgi:hypothetical protein